MDFIKKIGKSFIYIFSILLISILFFTTLNYFGIISSKAMNIIKFILLIISLLVGGFVYGKKCFKKGLIEGIKLSLIINIILILFNYLGLGIGFKIKHFIFYLIVMIVTSFGSVLGINRSKKK